MKFSSYLDPNFIFTDLKGKNPEEIIVEMVEKIAEKDNIINNVEDMTEKIKAEMQKEFSTQITSMQQSISELQKQRNQDQENFKKIVSDKISQLENMKISGN